MIPIYLFNNLQIGSRINKSQIATPHSKAPYRTSGLQPGVYFFPKKSYFPPPPLFFQNHIFSPQYRTNWRKIYIFFPLSFKILSLKFFPLIIFSLSFSPLVILFTPFSPFSPYFIWTSAYFSPKLKRKFKKFPQNEKYISLFTTPGFLRIHRL